MERVHIELKRVQTWLFSIPRLRAMAGANALLAEVLRKELPALAAKADQGWMPKPTANYPAPNQRDPWRADGAGTMAVIDDPREAAKQGIVSQDGGHFEVDLNKGGEAFAKAAAELLHRELPGLRFEIYIIKKKDGAQGKPKSFSMGTTFLSGELPVLTPCAWGGQGLASAIARQGKDREGASLEVCRRQDAARRAEQGEVIEPASFLLRKANIGAPASTFEELVAERYLAVIHADGNGVGGFLKSDKKLDSDLRRRAGYHHENRVLMRRALLTALSECKEPEGSKSPPGVAPILPLMLGGDDLLVVCRANVAMRFVVDLCEALQTLQADEGRGSGAAPLTLGVGVVIAPFTLPFHQLHEVAESLAGSAKRRVRDAGDEAYSVVDWAVFTSAWAEKEIAVNRHAHWLRGAGDAKRILSLRPLPVLCHQPHPYSLQALVEGASQLEDAPRSQLLYLVEQLARGKHLSELAFRELSDKAYGGLEQLGITGPWESDRASKHTRHAGSASSSKDELISFTRIHDLIEILEIPRLGSRTERHRDNADCTEEEEN